MSSDDRNVPGEQYVDLSCGTANLSPYSNSVPTYYPADYNWQHAQQLQLQTLPQETQSRETDRNYFSGFSDGIDVSSHGYITYGHQSMSEATFFSQSHNMWPTDNPVDHLTQGHINQHQFFSVIDLSQQGITQPANTTPSSTSKPKRRRVQSFNQRKAANVRERRRMFHLNEAFDELRKRLPAFNYEKRLSRIETLRLAMTYISFMKEVSVGMDPTCVKLKPHGADLLPCPGSNGSMLVSETYSSDKDNGDCHGNEGSDCSNDETSNDSGVH